MHTRGWRCAPSAVNPDKSVVIFLPWKALPIISTNEDIAVLPFFIRCWKAGH